MNQSYLGLILVIIVGYFGYDYQTFFNDASSPLLMKQEESKVLAQQVEEKKKKKEEAKLFFKTLEAKRTEVRALVEQLSQMKQTLSENSDVSGFSKYLFTEAKKIGLTMSSLTPNQRIKQQFYEELPFQIAFSGMFVQIVAFLERVSQADRIVRIESISLRPKGGQAVGAKFVELEGSALIKTFMYLGTQEDEMGREKQEAKVPANPQAVPGNPAPPAAGGAVSP
jgi:Tfp pilus assembly protein PilO